MSPARKGSQSLKNRSENIQVTGFMESITFFLEWEKQNLTTTTKRKEKKPTTHLSIPSRRKEMWPLPALWLQILYHSSDFYRKRYTEFCALKRKLQWLWTKNSNKGQELNLDFSFLSLLSQRFGGFVVSWCQRSIFRWRSDGYLWCESHISGSSCLSPISIGCPTGIQIHLQTWVPYLSPNHCPSSVIPNSKRPFVLAEVQERHLAVPFDSSVPMPGPSANLIILLHSSRTWHFSPSLLFSPNSHHRSPTWLLPWHLPLPSPPTIHSRHSSQSGPVKTLTRACHLSCPPQWKWNLPQAHIAVRNPALWFPSTLAFSPLAVTNMLWSLVHMWFTWAMILP